MHIKADYLFRLANAFRSYRPSELQDPMVAASIFMVVTLTSTPSFLTISEGLLFVRRLLVTFLIGLAVATGVSIFILPITSRRNVFKSLNACTGTIDKLFDAKIAFVRQHMNSQISAADEELDENMADKHPSHVGSSQDQITPILNSLRGLLSKINAELVYTEIEIAWGKLLPEDIVHIRNHINQLFLPLAGLSMLPEINQSLLNDPSVQQISKTTDHITGSINNDTVQKPSWDKLTSNLGDRLASTRALIATGLAAAFDLLEITPAGSIGPRNYRVSLDLEKQKPEKSTQSSNLQEVFRKELAAYNDRRRNLHKIWPSLMSASNTETQPSDVGELSRDHDVREHLLIFLSMEHLQNEALEAVHGLLEFAESKVNSGSMQRNKLIFPTHKLSELVKFSWLKAQNTTESSVPSSSIAQPWLGTKDAEHLPPKNWFERGGHGLRIIPRLLTSPQSVFGARVALATITVALLAYIRQTQDWFNRIRAIWALVVIVIGMKAESGASTFGYLARIGGTTLSLVLSLIVWYIVDGHTAGVLVFLYLANVFEVSTGKSQA